MEKTITSTRQVQWENVLFFGFTAFIALIATPIYIYQNGISLSEVLLFLFFAFGTGLAITVGYHRLYAHSTFKAHPIVHFFVLFFGAAAFEQSAVRWSAQHRSHHQFVDTDQDPYNIKKGFWYAHIGWLLFWHHETSLNNVKDLERNKLVAHQNNHMMLWGFVAGIFLPIALGVLTGSSILGAFFILVCARFVLIHHSTFSINSVCHMFGKSTYDIYASAKDHWFVAFLTNGEGYHNFHHRFPTDYRNGVRWYQWDPSKWMIAGLSKIGLTTNLRRVSRFTILEARLAAERQRVNDRLVGMENFSSLHNALDLLKEEHQKMKLTLEHWDHAVKEYQTILLEKGSKQSRELKKEALKKIRLARLQFRKHYSEWTEFISLHPLDLQRNLLIGSV